MTYNKDKFQPLRGPKACTSYERWSSWLQDWIIVDGGGGGKGISEWISPARSHFGFGISEKTYVIH